MPPRDDDSEIHFQRRNVELHPLLLDASSDDWMSHELGPVKEGADECHGSSVSSSPCSTASSSSSSARQPDNHPPTQSPTRHLVLPTDTMAGLCLFYRISARALQRANPGCCSGASCLPVYQWLVIPTSKAAASRQQNTTTDAYRQAYVKYHCPSLGLAKIKTYLTSHKNDVEAAVQEAKADLTAQEEMQTARREIQRRQRAEAVAVQTIYLQLARQQQRDADDVVLDIELPDHNTANHKSCCAAVQAQHSQFICQNLGLHQWLGNFRASDF